MELWLLALIALALIPIVRLFMAQACRPAAGPPGTEPLTVTVTADGAIPGFSERVDLEILSGELEVHPPRGHPALTTAVPRGGLFPGHEFPVRAEMFEGTESPYRWSASCSIEYEVRNPPAGLRSGRASASAAYDWNWDANRRRTIDFRLYVFDRSSGGPTSPGPRVPSFELRFEGFG